MKQKFMSLALVLVLILALAGCQSTCEHEWKDATCSEPKTCELCGQTEGAPLGHVWKAATCNAAKTCETCGKVEGEVLGHTWTDATCEAPKTCSTCQATEGDPLSVDDRFVTANCEALFGTWTGEYVQTPEDLGLTDIDAQIVSNCTLIFTNDGVCTIKDEYDLEEMKAIYPAIMEAFMYETYESMYDMDKAAADADMIATYGMTVPEYVQSLADALTAEDINSEIEFVYYVEDGELYLGSDWDEEDMACFEFTLEGDVLSFDWNGIPLVVTKTAE